MSVLAGWRHAHDRFRAELAESEALLGELRGGVHSLASWRLQDARDLLVNEVLVHEREERAVLRPFAERLAPDTAEAWSDSHAPLERTILDFDSLVWRRRLAAASNAEVAAGMARASSAVLAHLAADEALFERLSEVDPVALEQAWQAHQTAPATVPAEDSLWALNGRIHAHLADLLLGHLEDLTRLDLPAARESWARLLQVLGAHADVEDEVTIVRYEALGDFPTGGKPILFTSEHNGIRRMLLTLGARLAEWTEPLDRREMVEALDRYILFRHLLEHHTMREQNILYPRLDRLLAEPDKEIIAAALLRVHQAALATE